MIYNRARWRFALLFFFTMLPCENSLRSQTVSWSRELGTDGLDESFGVSADGLGNIYITGIASGVLEGSPGSGAGFVSKFDSAGTTLWTRQFGPPDTYVRPNGVSADKLGNIYITGTTGIDLGGPSAGDSDAFLAKYDSSGSLEWISQLGSIRGDYSYGVSADGLGNVYIAGNTLGNFAGTNAGPLDAFLSKFDAAGNVQWSQQLGTSSNDEGLAVSADALGNIFVSGYTRGSLGGTNAGIDDAYVSKFDASGALVWSRQFGTESIDRSFGVAADGLGNVYMAGETPGTTSMDAFVVKYDTHGATLWTSLLSSDKDDSSYAISSDPQGNAYITGLRRTNSTLSSYDAFLGKFDPSGNLLWSQQLGTSSFDVGRGVSADGVGGIYVTGAVGGSIDWGITNGVDAFLIKVQDVPEPSSLAIAMMATLSFGLRRSSISCDSSSRG